MLQYIPTENYIMRTGIQWNYMEVDEGSLKIMWRGPPRTQTIYQVT